MLKKLKVFFTKESISNAVSLCIAIRFYLLLSNIAPIKNFVGACINTVSPFIYAFVLAFILARPVNWFEEKVFNNRKSRRALSVFSVMIVVIFILYSLITAILPQIGQSVNVIIDALPAFTKQVSVLANKFFTENHFDVTTTEQLTKLWDRYSKQVIEFLSSAVPRLVSFTFNAGNGLVKILMIVIATIYMLIEKDTLCFQVKRITYSLFTVPVADRICVVTRRSDKIFSEFMTSKALDSLIIAVITFISMMFIYPEYSMLIAVIIGITNMIPVFGPFIGAIPSVFIMLMISPMKAVELTIFIIILQQVDGNIIGPKIMGNSLGLSALWILFAITVGGKLMGVAGMLIGVPTFAVIYSIVAENVDRILNEKNIAVDRKNHIIDTTNHKEKD